MHVCFRLNCANYLSRRLLTPIVRCCRSLLSSAINEATGMLNVTAFLQLLNTLPDGKRRQLFSQVGVADETGLLAKYDPALSGVEDSLERQLMQYDEYKLHKLLLLYVPPILLIVGTIGNLFSFVVLMMPPMRRVSTYLYVAALSVTDTLVLLVGLLRVWVAELQGYDIQNIADWTCKTINVLGYTVSDYSVWLIIAMTVERYVAVCHPLKAASFCSRTRAVKVSMSMQPWSLHQRRHTRIHTRALPQSVIFILSCHVGVVALLSYPHVRHHHWWVGSCSPLDTPLSWLRLAMVTIVFFFVFSAPTVLSLRTPPRVSNLSRFLLTQSSPFAFSVLFAFVFFHHRGICFLCQFVISHLFQNDRPISIYSSSISS